MKKTALILVTLAIFLVSQGQALAIDRDGAIAAYANELAAMGAGDAGDRAEREVDALIESMESDQYDMQAAMENINTQVHALAKTSSRKDSALEALEAAKDTVDDFKDMDADEYIRVQSSIAGALPYVTPDNEFASSQDAANAAIGKVRRIMIAPDRPGDVPTGDIVSDFIPQLIRQLFRFAWVAVLIAFTASGIMLILAYGNDERITKAKSMLYFTLIGFAFIALAFAIVKAVTDIDFFRFI